MKTAVMRGIAVAVITDVRGLDVDAGFEERDALGGLASALPLVFRALTRTGETNDETSGGFADVRDAKR